MISPRNIRIFLVLLTVKLVFAAGAYAQQISGNVASEQVPEIKEKDVNDYIAGVDKKMNVLDKSISKHTKKYLAKLSKRENKIFTLLSRIDSSAASGLNGGDNSKYAELIQKMQNADRKITNLTGGQYMPALDSISGSLRFLKDAKGLLLKSRETRQKIEGSLEQVSQFKNKLNQAEDIQQYIRERQQKLREILIKYPRLPKSITKSMGRFNESAYYYTEEIREIKEAMNDPVKIVEKGLEMLSRIPAFQQFMSKNSILGSLFPSPGNNLGVAPGINGLQTRADLQQILQRQFGNPSANNPSQFMQQQLQQAQGQLTTLKKKIDEVVNKGGGDITMPDFKPNRQKTKSFWQRIELGAGLQSQKANYFFPMRSDISLSAGYRLSDSKTTGIAIAGKVGWGRGWRQINVTAEGIGVRSFIDWKIKGNFWLTGGAEMNYLRSIDSLEHFKNYQNWTRSAVMGISRSYKLSKKLNGKVQLLYDFLHRQNHPATEPVIFRLGYTF